MMKTTITQDFKLISDLIYTGHKYKVIKEPLYVLNMENNISTNHREKQAFYANKIKEITNRDTNNDSIYSAKESW